MLTQKWVPKLEHCPVYEAKELATAKLYPFKARLTEEDLTVGDPEPKMTMAPSLREKPVFACSLIIQLKSELFGSVQPGACICSDDTRHLIESRH